MKLARCVKFGVGHMCREYINFILLSHGSIKIQKKKNNSDRYMLR